MEKPARGSTGVLIDSSRDAVAPKPCSPRRSTGPEMRRANSRQAELLELKLELEPPPQLVKPSALRLSPAPAASRADLARNWRRVRETSLIGNSPHPFDPQHHPSPAQRNSFCGGGVSLRRRLSTEPLTTNCSENTIVLQQFEFWQEEREGDFSLARSRNCRRLSDCLGGPLSKPCRLFALAMEMHTERGDICYEPFSGTGSHLVAAQQTGRAATRSKTSAGSSRE